MTSSLRLLYAPCELSHYANFIDRFAIFGLRKGSTLGLKMTLTGTYNIKPG